MAQKHADQCIFQHDCADCRKIREFLIRIAIKMLNKFCRVLQKKQKAVFESILFIDKVTNTAAYLLNS